MRIWASHQLHIHGFCKCSAVHWWFWKVNVKQMYKTCVRKANGKCPSNVWFAFVPMLWRAHQSGFGLSSAQYPLSSLLFGWGHGSGATNSHVSSNSVYTVMSILYHLIPSCFAIISGFSIPIGPIRSSLTGRGAWPRRRGCGTASQIPASHLLPPKGPPLFMSCHEATDPQCVRMTVELLDVVRNPGANGSNYFATVNCPPSRLGNRFPLVAARWRERWCLHRWTTSSSRLCLSMRGKVCKCWRTRNCLSSKPRKTSPNMSKIV